MRLRAALAGLLVCAAAFAQDPADPIPVPKLSGRVVDLTGTLTSPERDQLNAKLSAFEQSKGSQVVVLLVPSIGNEPIEDFAGRVTDEWKLGRKGVDDGVLFVIAKQQRKMRVHTGRGVQGVLTDATSKRIVAERVAPGFRTGDFAGGINAGVDAILKAIEGEALPEPAKKNASGKVGTRASLGDFFWILVFAVPVVGSLLNSLVGRLAGAGLTSGVTAAAAWWIFGSLLAAGAVGVLVFLASLFLGSHALRQARNSGWGGGGGWGSSGGWSGGGGGGDTFSGGGGGFDGGGASGDW